MTTTATTHSFDTTAKTACDEILKLKRKAQDVVGDGFAELRNSTGDTQTMRSTEQEILAELVDGASLLARDLVDVLQKIAEGDRPQSVMRSDLARRIQEAEVRLDLLRQLNS